jgi:hypothetical protein
LPLPGSSPRRDHAHDFVVAFFSDRVGHEHNGNIPNQADSVPAQLPELVRAVQLEQSVGGDECPVFLAP